MITLTDPEEPSDAEKDQYIYKFLRDEYHSGEGGIQILCKGHQMIRASPLVWSPTGDPKLDRKFGMSCCYSTFEVDIVQSVLTYLYDHKLDIPDTDCSYDRLSQLWRCAVRMGITTLAAQVLNVIADRFPGQPEPPLHLKWKRIRPILKDFSSQFPEPAACPVLEADPAVRDTSPPSDQAVCGTENRTAAVAAAGDATTQSIAQVAADPPAPVPHPPLIADQLPEPGTSVSTPAREPEQENSVPEEAVASGSQVPDVLRAGVVKRETAQTPLPAAAAVASPADNENGIETITLDDDEEDDLLDPAAQAVLWQSVSQSAPEPMETSISEDAAAPENRSDQASPADPSPEPAAAAAPPETPASVPDPASPAPGQSHIRVTVPVSSTGAPMQQQQVKQQQQPQPQMNQPLSIQTAEANSEASASNSQSPMSPNDAKRMCKNFLSSLIRVATGQPERVAQNVCKLIQGLIYGNITPEDFANQVQHELNSSPQPALIPFLKKSLPHLKQSLMLGEVTIEGVNPPPRTPLNQPSLEPAAAAAPPEPASVPDPVHPGPGQSPIRITVPAPPLPFQAGPSAGIRIETTASAVLPDEPAAAAAATPSVAPIPRVPGTLTIPVPRCDQQTPRKRSSTEAESGDEGNGSAKKAKTADTDSPADPKPKIKCDFCGQEFPLRMKLNHHQKLKHPAELEKRKKEQEKDEEFNEGEDDDDDDDDASGSRTDGQAGTSASSSGQSQSQKSQDSSGSSISENSSNNSNSAKEQVETASTSKEQATILVKNKGTPVTQTKSAASATKASESRTPVTTTTVTPAAPATRRDSDVQNRPTSHSSSLSSATDAGNKSTTSTPSSSSSSTPRVPTGFSPRKEGEGLFRNRYRSPTGTSASGGGESESLNNLNKFTRPSTNEIPPVPKVPQQKSQAGSSTANKSTSKSTASSSSSGNNSATTAGPSSSNTLSAKMIARRPESSATPAASGSHQRPVASGSSSVSHPRTYGPASSNSSREQSKSNSASSSNPSRSNPAPSSSSSSSSSSSGTNRNAGVKIPAISEAMSRLGSREKPPPAARAGQARDNSSAASGMRSVPHKSSASASSGSAVIGSSGGGGRENRQPSGARRNLMLKDD